MKTKICGITNLDDALKASEAGADALGFVFYEKSPRYIEPMKAREIAKKLPPFVKKVGLFVETSADQTDLIMQTSLMDIAQIHFEADQQFFDNLKSPFIRVIRAQTRDDLFLYADEFRFVDSFVEGYGGKGVSLPLEWFEGVDCSRIILAGGLTAKMLPLIRHFGFYGVDVSSGVELSKGIKDSAKVREFIERAKS